jgi:hypothetical protein
MPKKDFREYICRPYCMFFKEGQKEEMACRGADLAEKLILSKDVGTEGLIDINKKSRAWLYHAALFEKHICAACDFRAEDCDFASAASRGFFDTDIEPCGGLIFLAIIIEKGLIEMPYIKRKSYE